MTRNVAQNTRPSFRFSGEGSGDETNFVSYSLETGKPGFEAMERKRNEDHKVLLVLTKMWSVTGTIHHIKTHVYSYPPSQALSQFSGQGLRTRLVYSFILSQETQQGSPYLELSLVPRPRPAFRCLQYGKAWRAWYLFSREHDVIGKWQKFSEQTGCVSRIVQLTTRSTLSVYDNHPPLARYVR